jgi:DNA-binding MarR family transcriptional regulator
MTTRVGLNKNTWSQKLGTALEPQKGDRRFRHNTIDMNGARAIRAMAKAGFTQQAIAEAMHISQPAVSRTVRGLVWQEDYTPKQKPVEEKSA